jgi:hypothetical protein
MPKAGPFAKKLSAEVKIGIGKIMNLNFDEIGFEFIENGRFQKGKLELGYRH